MRKTLAALAATLVVAGGSAGAAPMTWELTLTFDIGGSVTGTMSIDHSVVAPNAFVTLSEFLSFDITLGPFHFTLANAIQPDLDGLLFDATGEASTFVASPGNFVEFCSLPNCPTAPGQVLMFHSGVNVWSVFEGTARGTYTFARVRAVPEPAALSLLGLGLGLALAAARRRMFPVAPVWVVTRMTGRHRA